MFGGKFGGVFGGVMGGCVFVGVFDGAFGLFGGALGFVGGFVFCVGVCIVGGGGIDICLVLCLVCFIVVGGSVNFFFSFFVFFGGGFGGNGGGLNVEFVFGFGVNVCDIIFFCLCCLNDFVLCRCFGCLISVCFFIGGGGFGNFMCLNLYSDS